MYHRQNGQKSDKSNEALQKQHKTSHTTAPQVNGTHPATLIQRAKLNPNSLNTDDVLRLQQTIGNRATTQLLAGRSGQRVQAKLTIGEPGDKYEQEADRVAAGVVKQIHAPVSQQLRQGQAVQREEVSEEKKELQRQPMLQLRSAKEGMTAAPEVEASIQQARASGQPLADSIREPMEQGFGADFSRVKVHTDNRADQLNQWLQAKAFTTGQDVFFRQGEYNPGSRGGQKLIAHELTHVVQQSWGAVMRSPQEQERGQQHRTAKTASCRGRVEGMPAGEEVSSISRGGAQAIQRLKKHAEAINDKMGLGLTEVTYSNVTVFIANESNDKENRRKLLEAWNTKQKGKYYIPIPKDLKPESVPVSSGHHDFMEWDSDDEKEMSIDETIKSWKLEQIRIQSVDGSKEKEVAVLRLDQATRVIRQIDKRREISEYFSDTKGLALKVDKNYLEVMSPFGNDFLVRPLEASKEGGNVYKRRGQGRPWREIAADLDKEANNVGDVVVGIKKLIDYFKGEHAGFTSLEAEALGAIAADFMRGSGTKKFIKDIEGVESSVSFQSVFGTETPLYAPAKAKGGRQLVTQETSKNKTKKQEEEGRMMEQELMQRVEILKEFAGLVLADTK